LNILQKLFKQVLSNLIYKAQCVRVVTSAIEIPAIKPMSVKFESVEDHAPGYGFNVYLEKKSGLGLAS
jgi:hypothetical protein